MSFLYRHDFVFLCRNDPKISAVVDVTCHNFEQRTPKFLLTDCTSFMTNLSNVWKLTFNHRYIASCRTSCEYGDERATQLFAKVELLFVVIREKGETGPQSSPQGQIKTRLRNRTRLNGMRSGLFSHAMFDPQSWKQMIFVQRGKILEPRQHKDR